MDPQPAVRRATQRHVRIEHTSLATGLGYHALVEAFERELRTLDPAAVQRMIEGRAAWSDVERELSEIAGPHGLMIVARIDLGRFASLTGGDARCVSYLVGHPLIAEQIVSVDVRGSFLVPFRVALYDDGDPGGAIIAYDRPSSLLATLDREELTAIGDALDRKIDAVAAIVRAG